MSHSIELFNIIDTALTELNIKRSSDYETGVIHFTFDCGRPIITVKVLIITRKSDYSVYAIFPISADSGNRKEIHALADFVCRANYGLVLGHFNLDPNDGEIQYQTTIDCTDVESPSVEQVKRAFGVTIGMCEKYAPGFQGVIFAGESPEHACERCEQDG